MKGREFQSVTALNMEQRYIAAITAANASSSVPIHILTLSCGTDFTSVRIQTPF